MERKRVKKCSVEGCSKPVKARGLCDNHYKIKQRSGELETEKYLKRGKFCSVENCRNPVYAKGLCTLHYGRFKKYGTTTDVCLASKTRSLSLKERLHYYGTGTNEKGCIIWEGSISDDGYGIISWKNYPLRAHRVSYELYKGKIPKGFLVCHHCDEKRCVNPDHLYAGTVKDNVRDAIERGLFPKPKKGEDSSSAKLTEDQAKEIIKRRKKGESAESISKDFNITKWTVYEIYRGRSWRSVNRRKRTRQQRS